MNKTQYRTAAFKERQMKYWSIRVERTNISTKTHMFYVEQLLKQVLGV